MYRLTSATLMLLFGLGLGAGVPLSAAEGPTKEARSNDDQAAAEQRPYIGIRPVIDDAGPGVAIAQVYPSSSAEKLGLEAGDRLTSFNGTTITNIQHLSRLIAEQTVGATFQAEWLRNEETLSGQADMGSLPNSRLQARQIGEIRGNMRRLQQERDALAAEAENGDTSPQDLAASMAELAEILNELPGRLETTAQNFKALYPNGTFTIHIDIDIRTNAEDSDAIELGPGVITPDTADESDSQPPIEPDQQQDSSPDETQPDPEE